MNTWLLSFYDGNQTVTRIIAAKTSVLATEDLVGVMEDPTYLHFAVEVVDGLRYVTTTEEGALEYHTIGAVET